MNRNFTLPKLDYFGGLLTTFLRVNDVTWIILAFVLGIGIILLGFSIIEKFDLCRLITKLKKRKRKKRSFNDFKKINGDSVPTKEHDIFEQKNDMFELADMDEIESNAKKEVIKKDGGDGDDGGGDNENEKDKLL